MVKFQTVRRSPLSHTTDISCSKCLSDDAVGTADNAGNTEAPGNSGPADEAESLADGSTEAGELFCRGFHNSTLISVVPPLDSVREFYLNVVIERIEQTYNTRGPGKPKTVTESKPGPKLPVLELSRSAIIESILEVHGLQERYLPGPISGPPFRLTFKGLA